MFSLLKSFPNIISQTVQPKKGTQKANVTNGFSYNKTDMAFKNGQ